MIEKIKSRYDLEAARKAALVAGLLRHPKWGPGSDAEAEAAAMAACCAAVAAS